MCLKMDLKKTSDKWDGIFSWCEKIVFWARTVKKNKVLLIFYNFLTSDGLNSLTFDPRSQFIRPILTNAADILDILQHCYLKIHETHFQDNFTLMPKNGLCSTSSYLHKWQNLFWLPRNYLLYLAPIIVLGNCYFKTIQPSPLFFTPNSLYLCWTGPIWFFVAIKSKLVFACNNVSNFENTKSWCNYSTSIWKVDLVRKLNIFFFIWKSLDKIERNWKKRGGTAAPGKNWANWFGINLQDFWMMNLLTPPFYLFFL